MNIDLQRQIELAISTPRKQGTKISKEKEKAIIDLGNAGFTQGDIAELTRSSTSTVSKYLRNAELVNLGDQDDIEFETILDFEDRDELDEKVDMVNLDEFVPITDFTINQVVLSFIGGLVTASASLVAYYFLFIV